MDLASALGLVLGVGVLALAQHLEGGQLASILQPQAALIVFGGTLGTTLLAGAPADLRRALRLLPRAFAEAAPTSQTVDRLIDLARIARKGGLVALDDHVKLRRQPLLRTAVQHVVDGTKPPALRHRLETDLDLQMDAQLAAARTFETAGGVAPTMGILGAVLGLIHVMEHLQEPAALGQGIATAFVATLYGVGAANLLFLPLARKLRRRIEEERAHAQIVVEGTLAIQEGSHPKAVEERLRAFARASDPRSS